MIDKQSYLWQYLSPEQQDLVSVGEFLRTDCRRHDDQIPDDYSYLVFPYAKMYEGFLKQLLLDKGIISEKDYMSDRFRIGKVLSPHLVNRLKNKSAYNQIRIRYNEELAEKLWLAWKNCRNQVFHYFPHNLHKLSRSEAEDRIEQLEHAMHEAVDTTRP